MFWNDDGIMQHVMGRCRDRPNTLSHTPTVANLTPKFIPPDSGRGGRVRDFGKVPSHITNQHPGIAMPRHPIAFALPSPYPPPPSTPHPAPSPLQSHISNTISSTDFDAVCIPLTNDKWQERWERLCLRPAEDDDTSPEVQTARDKAREKVDREADIWRKEGGFRREEVNVCRLEETQNLIGIAADWLELGSPDEGIRFDSELVSRFTDRWYMLRVIRLYGLSSHMPSTSPCRPSSSLHPFSLTEHTYPAMRELSPTYCSSAVPPPSLKYPSVSPYPTPSS